MNFWLVALDGSLENGFPLVAPPYMQNPLPGLAMNRLPSIVLFLTAAKSGYPVRSAEHPMSPLTNGPV